MADNITTGDFSSNSKTIATSEDGSAVHSPKIVNHTAQPTATYTRPADTTAYTAGDSISNSTSAPTALTFSSSARLNAGSGWIADATLITSTKASVAPEIHVWIFDTSPTATNDNSAFAPSDGDAANVQCVLIFSPSNMSDGSNNRVYKLVNKMQMFKCASASTTLYGLMLTKTDFTPGNAETYQVDLNIVQEM